MAAGSSEGQGRPGGRSAVLQSFTSPPTSAPALHAIRANRANPLYGTARSISPQSRAERNGQTQTDTSHRPLSISIRHSADTALYGLQLSNSSRAAGSYERPRRVTHQPQFVP